MESSPGVPWHVLASSNEDLFKLHAPLVRREVMHRLAKLAEISEEDLSRLSAEDLVRKGYCDPIRVFVKNEPHSLSKLKDKRYRLIMSVSVVDNIVERILCSELNNSEIARYGDLPAKPGMGFSRKHVDSVGAHLERLDSLHSTDVTGWDWSVSGEELRFDARRRICASGVARDHVFARLLSNRFTCLARSVISFSDGTMVAQSFDGLMKSGSYITSSGNSWIRYACALLSGSTDAVTMGDDCVEDCRLTAPRLRFLGHAAKTDLDDVSHLWQVEMKHLDGGEEDVLAELRAAHWEPLPTTFVPRANFCSHAWLQCVEGGGWRAVKLDWEKSFFRLLHHADHASKAERFMVFASEMQHSPALPHCIRELRRTGWFKAPTGDLLP